MPKFVDQASNSDKNTVSERQIQLNTVDPVEEKAKQTNPEAQNPNGKSLSFLAVMVCMKHSTKGRIGQ